MPQGRPMRSAAVCRPPDHLWQCAFHVALGSLPGGPTCRRVFTLSILGGRAFAHGRVGCVEAWFCFGFGFKGWVGVGIRVRGRPGVEFVWPYLKLAAVCAPLLEGRVHLLADLVGVVLADLLVLDVFLGRGGLSHHRLLVVLLLAQAWIDALRLRAVPVVRVREGV
jgi:hypothetical protein